MCSLILHGFIILTPIDLRRDATHNDHRCLLAQFLANGVSLRYTQLPLADLQLV
jgi:hypothetical protein